MNRVFFKEERQKKSQKKKKHVLHHVLLRYANKSNKEISSYTAETGTLPKNKKNQWLHLDVGRKRFAIIAGANIDYSSLSGQQYGDS